MPQVEIRLDTTDVRGLPTPGNTAQELKSVMKIGLEYEKAQKRAWVDALGQIAVGKITDDGLKQSIVNAAGIELNRIAKELITLTYLGKISTAEAESMVKPMLDIFWPATEKDMRTTLVNRMDNGDAQIVTIIYEMASPSVPSKLTIGYWQNEGPIKGNVEIDIPIGTTDSGGTELLYEDAEIVAQSGTLESVNFGEATKLIVTAANTIALKYQAKAVEVDEKIKSLKGE